ncbi:MAG: hypothetical protein H7Y03_03145 [Chitinophagaceae bacterium]|nr:hypothetical protein [Chitinophagaceae bacterium]
MNKRKEVDIIDKILDACYKEGSYSLFVMSLMHQYEERGSLSKKQLQGLYLQAKKIPDIPPNWLSTLEAVILKMPTRYKSEAPAASPLFQRDEYPARLIEPLLEKYPQHKRVLFLAARYNNNEVLTPAEITELEKFTKILLKK